MTSRVDRRFVFAIVGLVCATAAVLVARQVRDVAPRTSGSAVVSGVVVTDDASHQPVRRATVSLSVPGGVRDERLTSTDDAGRFAFVGVPAGEVTIAAGKPGFVTAYYGAKQIGSTLGTPLAVTEGQRITTVTIQLAHGAVVTGTIRDEAGRPLPGLAPRLQRVTTSVTGARTLSAIAGMGPMLSTTDDRGVYRLYGLPPGDYVLSIAPRAFGAGELRAPTPAEIQWAERQIASTSGPGSGPAADAPPPGAPVTYANLFYPGTSDPSQAGVIALAAGQERSGVDLTVQYETTARVEGTVSDPTGAPAAGIQLSVFPRGEGAGGADAGQLAAMAEIGLLGNAPTGRSDSNGSFVLSGIAEGDYLLVARTPARPAGRPGAGATPAPTLWAFKDVSVRGQDVRGLSLTLAPGLTVSGRIVFDSATGRAPGETARVTLSLEAVSRTAASALGSVPAAGGVFSISGIIPGAYRIGAAAPGWTLVSAMVGGHDAADVPFDIQPGADVSDVIATFTDTPAELTGILRDAANRPVGDLAIVLFSTDRSLWYANSRRVRPPVKPASDGRFTFTGLVAGDYYLAALPDAPPPGWSDAAYLDQIVPSAIKVTIAAGEKKTQDLKIAGGG